MQGLSPAFFDSELKARPLNGPFKFEGPLFVKVVQLQSDGSVAAGVQFTRLSKSNLQMIEAISQS